ncbi:MAG: GrpB family protein [Microbacterium sp.]|jgi:GrpB-like predicted nucleotidyltransferase (UPF0157 family)|nr:GrpB family protein [Microbacterium sp.]
MTVERVVLVDSRGGEWADRYAVLRGHITALLSDVPIEHIGSTSVPGMPSKDVVDVLVGVACGDVAAAASRLEAAGFDLEGARDGHAWLSSPHRAARTAVVHVVIHDGRQWRDRLDFRDLLRCSPEARDRYLAVKERAAALATGWGEYTAFKADTVTTLLAEYRAQQPGRMRQSGPHGSERRVPALRAADRGRARDVAADHR